ncbi:MAG: hypothetical protein PHV93_03480 [Candidatus Pacebacteria bacterium]|nr:hypothetical protein [Candidatus Paceibacterota bacterium]
MILKRVSIDVALFFAIIIFPWWVTLPVAFLLAFYIDDFYELIIVGFLLDLLESSPSSRFWGFQFIFTFSSILLFFLFRAARSKISLPDRS